MTAAILQVRRELTFGGESKAYRKMVEESSKRSKEATERLLAELLKNRYEDEPDEAIEVVAAGEGVQNASSLRTDDPATTQPDQQ